MWVAVASAALFVVAGPVPFVTETASAHTTTTYAFTDSAEGFTRQNDQPNSIVGWDDANDRISVESNRRDVNDELFQRGLDVQLTTGRSFTVTAKWRATEQGNWQGAWPVILANNAVDGVPRILSESQVLGIRYDSRDSIVQPAQRPHYVLHYRDAGGALRINQDFTGNANTEYHLVLDHNAGTRVITLRIRDAADNDLATATYTHGANANDGFTFDKVAVASDALDVDTGEPVAKGWVDDIAGVPLTHAPTAPRNLAVARGPGNGELSLSWLAPVEDGQRAITNYRIYRGSAAGAEALLLQVGNQLSFADTGLAAGVTRWYQVTAVNAMGESARSNEASATTFALPTTPQTLTATRGPNPGQISLSWAAPANDGGRAVTNYRVYRNGAFAAQVGAQLSFVDGGLPAGVTQSYQVGAVNSVGEGALSNAASSNAPTVATAPRNLLGSNGPGVGQVKIDWTAPADNGGNAITGYRIYRGTAAGQLTFLQDVGVVLTFTDSGIPNGATRFYKVSALNSVGESAVSNEASGMAPTIPSAAQGLAARPHPDATQAGKVRLDWLAPVSNGGRPVTNYRIYRGDTPGNERFLAQVGNVLTFTDEVPTQPLFQVYYYKVSAVNAAGLEGPPSNEACAMPHPWHLLPPVGPVTRCQ